MSTLETGTIEPQSGTTVTLGASGDAVVIGADALKVNTIKDAGANTILTSDGSGTLSSVNSGLAGNMVFISSATASGDSSLSFTSGIDSTYDEYVFIFVNINPASNAQNFGFQCSTDGGSNYNTTVTSTTFRAYHRESGTHSALEYLTADDQAQGTAYQTISPWLDEASDASGSGILHLFAPSSTTYVKQFYSRSSAMDAGPNIQMNDFYAAGYFNTTSAIDAVAFKVASGNFDGTIYLYGIK
jgi:hypothetical protein|tara:strand:- start:81 stop:809 length:729 start_codon:yes stop_codon:yes gene_type:complete